MAVQRLFEPDALGPGLIEAAVAQQPLELVRRPLPAPLGVEMPGVIVDARAVGIQGRLDVGAVAVGHAQKL